MLVSFVMAMFFKEWPESGELACQPFYRRPAASVVSADFGAHACRRDEHRTPLDQGSK